MPKSFTASSRNTATLSSEISGDREHVISKWQNPPSQKDIEELDAWFIKTFKPNSFKSRNDGTVKNALTSRKQFLDRQDN